MSWELDLHLRVFCYSLTTQITLPTAAFNCETQSCCSKWWDRLASLLELPEGSHAFHDTFQLICHLQSQAGPRPEFCTVLCFHLAILCFSGNVILLHSTAGTATDHIFCFLYCRISNSIDDIKLHSKWNITLSEIKYFSSHAYLSIIVLAFTPPRSYSAAYCLMRLITPLFCKSVRRCTNNYFIWVNVWWNCVYSMVLLVCIECWFHSDPWIFTFQGLLGFPSASKPQDESQFSANVHTVVLTVLVNVCVQWLIGYFNVFSFFFTCSESPLSNLNTKFQTIK